MAEGWKEICSCPKDGCHGSLQAPRHALTMQCTCDICGVMYLVCLAFGEPELWEHANVLLKSIAEEAVHTPFGRIFGGVGTHRNDPPRFVQISAGPKHDDIFFQGMLGNLEGGTKKKRGKEAK